MRGKGGTGVDTEEESSHVAEDMEDYARCTIQIQVESVKVGFREAEGDYKAVSIHYYCLGATISPQIHTEHDHHNHQHQTRLQHSRDYQLLC